MSTPVLGFLAGKPSGQHDPEKPAAELSIAAAYEITDDCVHVSPDTSRAVIAYLKAESGMIAQVAYWPDRNINSGPRENYWISGVNRRTAEELARRQPFYGQAERLGIDQAKLAMLIFNLMPKDP